jgi:hypothetical protein
MACDVTLGRKIPCKDIVGGITRIWFVNFGDITAITQVSDEITNMTGVFSAYQYDVKGTSSLEQAITSSRDTGTTFVDQTLTLSLPKLSKEDNLEVKLLAYGRPQIVIEDYNSNFFLAGLDYGCELTGGTIATGGNMSEMSGYTLTFLGTEKIPANFIAGATTADPFDGMAGVTATIVQGTNS